MARKMIVFLALFLAVIAAYYFYPEQKLASGSHIDAIAVFKSKREMHVYSEGKLLKKYTVSLGKEPIGAKQFEGDFKTPEGVYTINERNPNSGYHKNLGVSYPSEKDLSHALKLGKPVGGDIKIHGIRNGGGAIGKFHRWRDWTAGCIAVTNSEIDELYAAVIPNATITIYP